MKSVFLCSVSPWHPEEMCITFKIPAPPSRLYKVLMECSGILGRDYGLMSMLRWAWQSWEGESVQVLYHLTGVTGGARVLGLAAKAPLIRTRAAVPATEIHSEYSGALLFCKWPCVFLMQQLYSSVLSANHTRWLSTAADSNEGWMTWFWNDLSWRNQRCKF